MKPVSGMLPLWPFIIFWLGYMVFVERFYFKILCAESRDHAQMTKISYIFFWNVINGIYFIQNFIESVQ